MSQKDDPNEVLREVIRSETARIHTVLPATILDYDHSEQRATVQSRVEFSYRDPETGERRTYYPEPVPNCPVRFPAGGGFSLTFPLKSGDPVKLCVAERSIDEVMEQGGDRQEPQDPRRFNLSDAIVEPGLRSFANALGSDRIDGAAAVLYAPSGEEIHLGKAGLADSRFVAIADLVEQEIDDVRSTLNDLISKYNSHTHQGSASNVSGANQGSSASAVDPVASDKIKAQ